MLHDQVPRVLYEQLHQKRDGAEAKAVHPYYIDDYEKAGVQKQAGNGGFFHSCYLGSYFQSGCE